MTTKSQPSYQESQIRWRSNLYSGNGSPVTWQTGSNTISYEDGRRSPSGHWPWKACIHTVNDKRQPIIGATFQSFSGGGKSRFIDSWNIKLNWASQTRPTGAWDESVLGNLLDQIDLNCNDSVMLYANVVQALPFLGGVMRLNHILRDVAKHISKGMRRKPFTTVIKSLISADFIDRFVISPTLDDARKFQDACDYVLRTITTARERSSGIFALESASKTVHSETEKTENIQTYYGPTWELSYVTRKYTESKAFMLCRAKYDVGGIDPIKLWATRTGFTRPLESVWDLVPFSFVADYFARGQDFITALSNEISDQAGLCGTITDILDIWGTVNNTAESVMKSSRRIGSLYPDTRPAWHLDSVIDLHYPWAGIKSQEFRRFRVSNPWHKLARLESQPEDWCRITLNPSTVQKRTIAELVIQAKL